MKEIFRDPLRMVLEYTRQQMVIDMKETGLTINDMEMVCFICVMEINIKGNGRMERNVEREYYILLLETSTMDIGWEG